MPKPKQKLGSSMIKFLILTNQNTLLNLKILLERKTLVKWYLTKYKNLLNAFNTMVKEIVRLSALIKCLTVIAYIRNFKRLCIGFISEIYIMQKKI